MSKDDYLIVCGDFGLLFNYRETGKSLPSCLADYLYREGYRAYELPDFLLNIKETVDYKRWYCGHHHKDTGYGRVRILYDDIVQIGE